MMLSNQTLAQLFRFALVGAAGFVVDSAVLYAALYAGAGLYGGRVLSYLCAATFTWYCNRRFTFASTNQNQKTEWARFTLLNLGGFAVNYGTYAVLVAGVPLVAAHPILGVAAGSVAGLFVNFGINKFLVFR